VLIAEKMIHKLLHWFKKLMLLKWMKPSIQSSLLVRLVVTAPYIKVKQVLMLVVAYCLVPTSC